MNSKDIEDIKNKILALSKEIEDTAQRDFLNKLLKEIESFSNEKVDEIKDDLKMLIKSLEDFTRKHPLFTITLVGLIGYILGKNSK